MLLIIISTHIIMGIRYDWFEASFFATEDSELKLRKYLYLNLCIVSCYLGYFHPIKSILPFFALQRSKRIQAINEKAHDWENVSYSTDKF